MTDDKEEIIVWQWPNGSDNVWLVGEYWSTAGLR